MEFAGKKALRIVTEVFKAAGYGEKDVRLTREEAQIAVAGHPVCRVACPSKSVFNLSWYAPGCSAAGVREDLKEEIKKQFISATGRVPSDQWSV